MNVEVPATDHVIPGSNVTPLSRERRYAALG
jgi:hypothetical protein